MRRVHYHFQNAETHIVFLVGPEEPQRHQGIWSRSHPNWLVAMLRKEPRGALPRSWAVTFQHTFLEKLESFLQTHPILGGLAGSVGRACDSQSQSCEFEPYIGCRDSLKIKSFKKKCMQFLPSLFLMLLS